MAMSLRLLGEFELLTGDPPVRVAVPNGRAATLFKLVAVRRNRVVPLDSVIDALWADRPPDAAAQVISSLVSRLRRIIGRDLQRFDDGYRLDTSRWTVDLDEAVRLVQTSQRRLDAGEPALADAAARRAVRLLSLGLLAGSVTTDWLARARTEYDALVRQARQLAWTTADAVGDYDRARAFAEAAIADDSLDEVAYRALMTAHHRAGRPALALRTYMRLRNELSEQLGTSPDRATDQLHVGILRGLDPEPRQKAEPHASTVRPSRALVGRDDVLARSETVWQEAVEGAGRSLLIRGTPGSGRTAVLTEIVRFARSTGGEVLTGCCAPGTRRLPLHSLAHAFRSYYATAHPDVIRASVGDFGDVACWLVPDLAESVPAGTAHSRRASLRRTRVVEGVVQFVARIASQQPVLIALDDAGYADPLTLSALTAVRQRLADAPIALVATTDLAFRPDPFGPAAAMCLAPLDRTATALLAERSQLGHLADSIHALTAGHPRFVVEALRAARRGADLTAELPQSLVDAAIDRIEHAGPAVVDVLTKIAALGLRFTGAEAVRVGPEGTVTALRRAVDAGLLLADGELLAFESELLRAALCAATPTPLRPLLGFTADACVPALAGTAA
ncbi:BTAD domain-containing putative transcriptional regulator [Kribbella shirazensis]|uniref:DNA-binding SARP family transcriptional activator n=1 Tax=Kribbella shirazensis TaxID=1105143 RepID=A0A7X6A4W9_9ACTN|nr:BTAD domain-containing putative transcriptional regulator [Kribbella shirazensis]NIK61338.1 DNA-binding SARP family transcriptional activator [Kribbella shirazensis]